MLPIVARRSVCLPRVGFIGSLPLHAVGRPPTSSALHGIESSGVRVSTGVFQPPARSSLLWPLLTSRGISSAGSPQVRTRCFPTQPPHLPPRPNRWTSLCGASSSPRVGLLWDSCASACRFLLAFLPPERLPSRSWLQIVIFSCFHVSVFSQGTLTPFTTRPCWAHTNR